MQPPEPPFPDTLRQTVAERPTFAAMALLAIHDRDREIAWLRRLVAMQTMWLRIWDAYRRLPAPRPALTAEQIDQITCAVIAALSKELG